jgi:hypothetical protein
MNPPFSRQSQGLISRRRQALKHNARGLCAVAPPASVPLIETHSVWRRRCDCPPLSRPHNPRYVQVPARARLNALRAGRCAAFLIAMADTNNRRPAIRARVYQLSVFPPAIVVRYWPFSVAPCSPCQGQTLTRLRSMQGGPGQQLS